MKTKFQPLKSFTSAVLLFCLPMTLLADKISLSSDYHVDSVQHLVAQEFVNKLRENNIVSLGDGSLFSYVDGLKSEKSSAYADLMQNKASMAEFLLATQFREKPILRLDTIPFLTRNEVDAVALWQATEGLIRKAVADYGLTLLYVVPGSPKGLITNRKIQDIEDFSRLIYADNFPFAKLLYNEFQANYVNVGYDEVVPALQNNTISAAFVAAEHGTRNEIWKVASNYYHLTAWYPKSAMVMKTDEFNLLPSVQKSAIINAANHTQERVWDIKFRKTKEDVMAIRRRGLMLNLVSSSTLYDLEKIGRKILYSWSEEMGAEGIPVVEKYYNTRQSLSLVASDLMDNNSELVGQSIAEAILAVERTGDLIK